MSQDSQTDKLIDILAACASALRWLWITNLIAAIAGIAFGRYELTAVAGISLLAALAAAAGVGRSLRILASAAENSVGDREG